MRNYKAENNEAKDISFGGVEYSFLVHDKGIGIRRKDDKPPMESEVRMITRYVFAEGWADKEDYKDINEF